MPLKTNNIKEHYRISHFHKFYMSSLTGARIFLEDLLSTGVPLEVSSEVLLSSSFLGTLSLS